MGGCSYGGATDGGDGVSDSGDGGGVSYGVGGGDGEGEKLGCCSG